MPNWTSNKIIAKQEVLDKYIEDDNFDFNLVIPQPTEEKDCPKRYLRGDTCYAETLQDKPWFNWYDWNIDNWGTKWDACETLVDDGEVQFSTAWSMPIPIFEKICKDNPNEDIIFEVHDEDGEYADDGEPIPVVYYNKQGKLARR